VVNDPVRGVENLRPLVSGQQFNNRIGLLEEMEAGFHRTHGDGVGNAHRTTYQRAVNLLQSREAQAFDLSREPASSRAAYGTGRFAEGCLLARRLIETGVSFVEVSLGGWDTHTNNFERVRTLSGQVDPAMSALIRDLHQRGLLNDTLVIWMGEFGRTPRINQRGAQPGRDHYPRAWSSVMFGGGLPHGRVVGRTDADGAVVQERPVNTLDFMASMCRVLGIDYTKMNTRPSAGRCASSIAAAPRSASCSKILTQVPPVALPGRIGPWETLPPTGRFVFTAAVPAMGPVGPIGFMGPIAVRNKRSEKK